MLGFTPERAEETLTAHDRLALLASSTRDRDCAPSWIGTDGGSEDGAIRAGGVERDAHWSDQDIKGSRSLQRFHGRNVLSLDLGFLLDLTPLSGQPKIGCSCL